MAGEENQGNEGQEELSPISKLFRKVVTDQAFKELLIKDPDEALKGFDLSEAQIIMIRNLDAEDIDKLTPENLEEFFSADAAVYTPDEADIADEDAYSPEDFLDLEDEYESAEDEDL